MPPSSNIVVVTTLYNDVRMRVITVPLVPLELFDYFYFFNVFRVLTNVVFYATDRSTSIILNECFLRSFAELTVGLTTNTTSYFIVIRNGLDTVRAIDEVRNRVAPGIILRANLDSLDRSISAGPSPAFLPGIASNPPKPTNSVPSPSSSAIRLASICSRS